MRWKAATDRPRAVRGRVRGTPGASREHRLALTALQVRRGAVLAGAVALVMLGVGVGVGLVAPPVEPPIGSPGATGSAPDSGGASEPVPAALAGFGGRPGGFEANRGQTDPEVRFLSRGPGHSLFLTSEEFVLSLHAAGGAKGASQTVLRMRLLGAAPQPQVEGLQQLAGTELRDRLRPHRVAE